MKTFICANCGQEFEPTWDDTDAEAEAQRLWGVAAAASHPDMAVICEDCFQHVMAWLGEDPAPPH
jgi:hypothetical protein